MLNPVYARKVALLLRLIPFVAKENVFAVHGGTAINLFVQNMLRYSVDIDLTYIPLAGREESINDINIHLSSIAQNATKTIPNLHVVPHLEASKLLCEYRGYQVKIEVNQTKRGIIGGAPVLTPVCAKIQEDFKMYCEAPIVPLPLLYGGKVAAALSRQHPRDLFDVKLMPVPLSDIREGLLFCLLSSDRPIHESLAPTLIDQREAMTNQFNGMTNLPFSYEDYERTRLQLIRDVNTSLTDADKHFLLSFEQAEPDWDNYEFAYFQNYPSIQWKLLNLTKLKNHNPRKLLSQLTTLRRTLNL